MDSLSLLLDNRLFIYWLTKAFAALYIVEHKSILRKRGIG